MIFVAIFMDDIDEVVLGHICKSNMAIQLVAGNYINIANVLEEFVSVYTLSYSRY